MTITYECSPKVFETFGFVRTKYRKCRDCSCAVVFLLSWLAYLIIGSIGIHKGKPETFVYGIDYEGNTCGTGAFSSQRNIIYPRTNQDLLWNLNTVNPLEYKFYGICTDKCPGNPTEVDFVCNYNVRDPRTPLSQTSLLDRTKILDCLSRTDKVQECRFYRTNCWFVPVETRPILYRCIPIYRANYTKEQECIFPPTIRDARDANCLVVKTLTQETMEEPATPVLLFDQLNQLYYSWGRYVTDLVRGWWVIVLSAIVLPAILSLGWLYTMKSFTRGVIVSSLVILVTLSVILCLFLFAQAGRIQYDWIAQYNLEKYAFMSNDQTLYLAYSLAIFLVITLCVLIAMRRNIARSIDVMRLGSKALKKLPMTLVFPAWVVVLMFGLFVWAAFVAASLASAGNTVVIDMQEITQSLLMKANDTLPPKVFQILYNSTESFNGTLTYYASDNTLSWLQIVNVFMFLWSLSFAHGMVIMVVSSSVAMWYFSKNKSKQRNLKVHKMPKFYIMDSLTRTLCFQMGTLALGSFLIASLSMIRFMVAWIQARLQNVSPHSQYIPATIRSMLDCIIQCFLRGLQRILEIVTHYSYIYAALKGQSFSRSGGMVFGLILKYTSLLTSVSVMCTAVIFLCKVSICVSACFMYYMIVSNVPMFLPGGEHAIVSPVISIIVCFLLAYTISTAFFNVFDIAVDTILICYITDIDENQLRHMGDPKFRFPAHVKPSAFAFLPRQVVENVAMISPL